MREWRGELGMGVGNSRDNMPQPPYHGPSPVLLDV